MKTEEFEKLVSEAFDSIPEKFRKKVENVALTVEDTPSQNDLQQKDLKKGSLLLGLYVGVPATARGVDFGAGVPLPDVIKIFKEPIEEVAHDDPERVRRLVKETVLHEYAHYFGMSETAVRQWERQGREKEKE